MSEPLKPHTVNHNEDEKLTAITLMGQKIDLISHMTFNARTLEGSKTGWDGYGSASVDVHSTLENSRRVVRLNEQGEFRLNQGRPVPFKNLYRLTWYSDHIQLHHERRGEDHAVWLFDLVASEENTSQLVSHHPHPCGHDTYSAVVTLQEHGFSMTWEIKGPRKNEYLEYRYE